MLQVPTPVRREPFNQYIARRVREQLEQEEEDRLNQYNLGRRGNDSSSNSETFIRRPAALRQARANYDPYATTVRGRYVPPQEMGRGTPRRDDPLNSFERLGVRGRAKMFDQRLIDRAQDDARRMGPYKQQTYGPQNLAPSAREDTTDVRPRMMLRQDYIPDEAPAYSQRNRPTMKLRQDFRQAEPVYYGPENRPAGYEEPLPFYGPENRPAGYQEPILSPEARQRLKLRQNYLPREIPAYNAPEPVYYGPQNRPADYQEPVMSPEAFERLKLRQNYLPREIPGYNREPAPQPKPRTMQQPAQPIPKPRTNANLLAAPTARMEPIDMFNIQNQERQRRGLQPLDPEEYFARPENRVEMGIPKSDYQNQRREQNARRERGGGGVGVVRQVHYGPTDRPDDNEGEEVHTADGSGSISVDKRRRERVIDHVREARMSRAAKRPKLVADGKTDRQAGGTADGQADGKADAQAEGILRKDSDPARGYGA